MDYIVADPNAIPQTALPNFSEQARAGGRGTEIYSFGLFLFCFVCFLWWKGAREQELGGEGLSLLTQRDLI